MKNINTKKLKEFTIECNPETLDKEKLSVYKKVGINRLSLGFQSFDNKKLKFLGRLSSRAKNLEIFNLAKMLDFKNVNIDLIYGLPNETLKEWLYDLNIALTLSPEHISAYSLKIEEGSLFFKKKLRISEDLQAQIYRITYLTLKNIYHHYEISNYAKPGYESLHNLNYWRHKEFLGFGAGAWSYINKKRWKNHSSPYKYINSINNSEDIVEFSEGLSEKELAYEEIMLKLRLSSGLSGKKIPESIKEKFKDYFIQEGGKIRLNLDGQLILDYILKEIL